MRNVTLLVSAVLFRFEAKRNSEMFAIIMNQNLPLDKFAERSNFCDENLILNSRFLFHSDSLLDYIVFRVIVLAPGLKIALPF